MCVSVIFFSLSLVPQFLLSSSSDEIPNTNIQMKESRVDGYCITRSILGRRRPCFPSDHVFMLLVYFRVRRPRGSPPPEENHAWRADSGWGVWWSACKNHSHSSSSSPPAPPLLPHPSSHKIPQFKEKCLESGKKSRCYCWWWWFERNLRERAVYLLTHFMIVSAWRAVDVCVWDTHTHTYIYIYIYFNS